MKKTILASVISVSLLISTGAQAVGSPPAPSAGQLGAILVDPYGYSPLTAYLDLANKKPTDVVVTVHGKGKTGVDITYPVGPQTILSHDAIPVFGLYPDYKNKVTLTYKLDGKKVKESYDVITSALRNKYIDNRNVTALQEVKVTKVDKKFKSRLYLVNSHTDTQQGSDLHWSGVKSKSASLFDSTPALGSMTFESAPMTYIVDTQGEYRWWLDQDAVYNAKDIDINKRGYLMGLRKSEGEKLSYVQGQRWGYLDLMGRINSFRLPRGYQDASHESVTMPNGDILVRAAKTNYLNSQGDIVHTVRDHILQINQRGVLVDAWALPEILDPYRDALLSALDMGAVCVNVDQDSAGVAAGDMEIDAPYGDLPGVVAGRNWAHVNSIDYDKSDDSIILSFRHQGVAKVTRDKQVKWILAPREGWNKDLTDKVLQPVDAKGKPIKCTEKGVCENSEFDWSYTQHTAWLSSKGTLTVLDNGDGRGYTQPVMPEMKYSRFVEYKINEKNMTVEQLWEYGKDRGYEWYSPITSNVEYVADTDTMFGFGGSIGLFDPSTPTIGRINEIDYKTKEVKVEIDVFTDKVGGAHYRALFIEPEKMFSR